MKTWLRAARDPLISTIASEPSLNPGSLSLGFTSMGSSSAKYTSFRPPRLPPGSSPLLMMLDASLAFVPWAIVRGISAGLTRPRPSISAVTSTECPFVTPLFGV